MPRPHRHDAQGSERVRPRLAPRFWKGASWSPFAPPLILPFLLVTTYFLAWFGVEDLAGALAYTGRVTGMLLILASAATLLGALGVVDHWYRDGFAYSGLVALLGTVTAAVANIMLIIATLRDGDSTPYLVLWCVLAAGSGWAAVMVYRTPVVIPAPRRVAAAVIVSSAVAIANFGYNQLYQPYQRTASPVIQMDMGNPVMKADRRAFALPVTVRLDNRSNVGFYVFGTQFTVLGHRMPVSSTDRLAGMWRRDLEAGHELSRWENSTPGQMVEASDWMPVGHWVDPGATFVTTRIVELPVNTPYDQISVYATADFARRDRLGLENEALAEYSWRGKHTVPQWLKGGRYDYMVYQGRIRESNAISAHTRAPHNVTIWWLFGDDGAWLVGSITRKGEEDRIVTGSDAYQTASQYGFAEASSGKVARSLWDIKRGP